MSAGRSVLLAGVLVMAAGCMNIQVQGPTEPEPGKELRVLRLDGGKLISSFVAVGKIPDWSGTLLDVGRGSPQRGEVVSVDLWPILGLGVGIAGVRLRVLPFEVGIGTLFYDPRATVKGFEKEENGEEGKAATRSPAPVTAAPEAESDTAPPEPSPK